MSNQTIITAGATTARRFNPDEWYTRNAENYQAQWDDFTVDELVEFANIVGPGATVADVACGSGRDVAAGRALGLDMRGSDISEGQVAIAASKNAGPIVQASYTDLPYDDESLDGIWAYAAIVHATPAEARAALTEFARCTRAGGRMFINVKAADRLDDDGFDPAGRWFHLWAVDQFAFTVHACGWDIDVARERADAGRDYVSWVDVLATRR